MMPRSRRSGGGSSGGGGGGTTRTHMLFSQQKELHVTKRKRKTHNRLQQHLHKKDEMIQTGPDELDPSLWTGNQRVLHYGPLAQRDPFFYYYPKGWDILYPAHFGFFPYRTSKFRGSSTVICIWAFGLFFIFGGGLMVYLGYFVLYKTPFWTWPPEQLEHFPPIQIAGPILFGFGGILVFLGMILSLFTSQFLNEKLRHYHHRDQPPQTVIYTTLTQQPRGIIEKHPYQPLPPPAYPVLENRYARSSMFNPQAEMKLYPPVMPGYSTLSLHSRSPSAFMGAPYNALRSMSVNRMRLQPIDDIGIGEVIENPRTTSISASSERRKSRLQSGASRETARRRARSIGAMQS